MSSLKDETPEFLAKLSKREQIYDKITCLEDNNEIVVFDDISVFTKIGILNMDDSYMESIFLKLLKRENLLSTGDLCQSEHSSTDSEWWKVVKTRFHRHLNCTVIFSDSSRIEHWDSFLEKNKINYSIILKKKQLGLNVQDKEVVLVDESLVNHFFAIYQYCFQRIIFDETTLTKDTKYPELKLPKINSHFIWILVKTGINVFHRKSWIGVLPLEQTHLQRITFAL